MKKSLLIALLAALTISLSNCNVSQKVTDAYASYCPNSSIKKQKDGTYLVYVDCKLPYDTVQMAKYIKQGRITYDFAGGRISGTVQTADSIPNLYGVLITIAKGAKKPAK